MGEVRHSVVVEGVGKRFDLHQARTGSLRELLSRKKSGEARPETKFWALENVTFTVEPGHPLAIIGHNGSGKSTLLKLLTGILRPTKGNIDIRGRVGALIEVGAGFHPDLTGRENVYLNGSILGASKREMEEKFDRIVAFAGLERFIDTPVKRYSSGMYMRLGFSIAAHLEPDILLIDEVLAVGDAQFQSRCLTYLKDYVKKGGSVIFVSHAMSQVKELCDRVVWLDRGQMMGFGEAQPLIDRYEALVVEREDAEFQKLYPDEWAERQRRKERQEQFAALIEKRDELRQKRRDARVCREELAREEADRREANRRERLGRWDAALEALSDLEKRWQRPTVSREGELLAVRFLGADGCERTHFAVGEGIRVEVDYRFLRPLPSPAFCFEVFRRSDDLHLFTTSNFDHGIRLNGLDPQGTVAFRIEALTINAGSHRVRLRLYSDWIESDWDSALAHSWEDAATLEVMPGPFAHGAVYVPVCWEGIDGK